MNFWERMGLAGKRVILVHHDDLGASKAQNDAYRALPYPTGSILVPAPQTEDLAKNLRKDADLGVHLMLSSGAPEPIRPLTNGGSLRAPNGGFWKTRGEAWMNIKLKEAEAEMRAQIERALAMGFDLTHIDTHMGTVLRPDLAKVYLKLALRYQLPPFIAVNIDFSGFPEMWQGMIKGMLGRYLPLVNYISGYWVPPEQKKDWYVDALSKAGPGIHHFLHHAATAPEGPAIPVDSATREADFAALSHPDVKRAIDGFVPLTYRQVRDVFRKLR